jgi:hypothetical protein
VDQSDPRETPPNAEPGRFRAAMSVLRGERLVPLQIHAEWIEYQQIFDDILTRWSASLARDAKSEKKRVDRLSEGFEDQPHPTNPASIKAALRTQAATMHRVGALPPVPNGVNS